MKPVTVLTGVLMTFVGGSLDAYTFVGHGVFATAQTGNVVLLAIGIVDGRAPWQYLWPILAFLAAVMAVQRVKDVSDERRAYRARGAVLGLEVVLLIAVGFVPHAAASEWITVPLAVLAGIQLGLFRAMTDLGFVSVASTGNLMRLVEAAYGAVRTRTRKSLRVFLIGALVVAAFVAGAVFGAVVTGFAHTQAIWAVAAVQAVVFVVYLVESSARPSDR